MWDAFPARISPSQKREQAEIVSDAQQRVEGKSGSAGTITELWERKRSSIKEGAAWNRADEVDDNSCSSSDEDDEDRQPLLSPGGLKKRAPSSATAERLLTVVYFCVMAINGGMIGAFGPSLQMLERATGLTEYEVGKFVMQNRLSKLAGTIAWCLYAGYLQGEQQRGRTDRGKLTHQLMVLLMGATAVFSLIIGNLASRSGLQMSLICWGFVYGLGDSGVTSLTLWRWAHDDRRRRFDVALLNSGFTVGALITPVLVAASLRYGGGRWTFDVIAAAAVGVCAMLPMLPDAPMPPLSMSDKGDGDKGEGGALKRVDAGSAALEHGKGSDEVLDGKGDDEWRGCATRPGELGVNPRQLVLAARHYTARLVRAARQQMQLLRNPSDELTHQALHTFQT